MAVAGPAFCSVMHISLALMAVGPAVAPAEPSPAPKQARHRCGVPAPSRSTLPMESLMSSANGKQSLLAATELHAGAYPRCCWPAQRRRRSTCAPLQLGHHLGAKWVQRQLLNTATLLLVEPPQLPQYR